MKHTHTNATATATAPATITAQSLIDSALVNRFESEAPAKKRVESAPAKVEFYTLGATTYTAVRSGKVKSVVYLAFYPKQATKTLATIAGKVNGYAYTLDGVPAVVMPVGNADEARDRLNVLNGVQEALSKGKNWTAVTPDSMREFYANDAKAAARERAERERERTAKYAASFDSLDL